MKKEYLIVLIILIVFGASYFVIRGSTNNAPSNSAASQETPNTENENNTSENTVIYTESGFAPSSITVETGATVSFINQSNRPMWVASDPHPVHTDFSAFDQLGSEDEYSFTFTQAGQYTYHNHLAPTHNGVVVVE